MGFQRQKQKIVNINPQNQSGYMLWPIGKALYPNYKDVIENFGNDIYVEFTNKVQFKFFT